LNRFEVKSILDIGAGHPILAVPLSKKVEKYIGSVISLNTRTS